MVTDLPNFGEIKECVACGSEDVFSVRYGNTEKLAFVRDYSGAGTHRLLGINSEIPEEVIEKAKEFMISECRCGYKWLTKTWANSIVEAKKNVIEKHGPGFITSKKACAVLNRYKHRGLQWSVVRGVIIKPEDFHNGICDFFAPGRAVRFPIETYAVTALNELNNLVVLTQLEATLIAKAYIKELGDIENNTEVNE